MNVLAPFRRAISAFTAKGAVDATVIPPSGRWHRIVERNSGDWQRRIRAEGNDILQMPSAFAAQGLISQDFAKLTQRLVRWNEAARIFESASLDWVDDLLARPNPYQNILQFAESWQQSKQSSGNAYALKSRNEKGKVRALYILDPWRIRVRVSPAGSVFYGLQPDNLSGVSESVIVPASEIIHDRFNTLYHPLVGVSPLYALTMTASLGMQIQDRASRFWANDAQPGGAIIVPTEVEEDEVERIRQNWQANFAGENLGRTAILAGGMDYKPFSQTAKESQLIETLKLTREEIATAYRLPLYKLNGAPAPSVTNTGQLDQEYYSQCQQMLVTSYEMAMTQGLELPRGYKIDLDENDLLRMDPLTKAQVTRERVTGGWWTLNEARRVDNLAPKDGGDKLLVQEQYWPAAAVGDPARGVPTKTAPAPAANDDDEDDSAGDDATERALAAFAKGLRK